MAEEKLELQIKEKQIEVSNIIQDTVSQYYGLDLVQSSVEANKKKQEIAMFVSKLISTKNKTGAPAILTSSIDSIRECALTFVNGDFDFFRNQAYLISYGDTLQFMISKDGLVATAKKVVPNLELYSEIVYKNDKFEYQKIGGKTVITNHEQKIENVTGKLEDIVCAYACAWIDDKQKEAEIMTMEEITKALATAKRSITEYHKNNPKIMFGKFPLRRLAKRIINQNIPVEIANKVLFSENEIEPIVVEPIKNESQSVDIKFEEDNQIKSINNNFEIPEFEENPFDSSSVENAISEFDKEENDEEPIGTIKQVYYSDWKNTLKETGKWKLTDRNGDDWENGYNKTKKIAEIIKIK